MKVKDWVRDRAKLKVIYLKHGITSCEGAPINPKCKKRWMLSFHHLDRRSSGKAKNTFEDTRLLCAECHYRADQSPGFKEFNEKLRHIRKTASTVSNDDWD